MKDEAAFSIDFAAAYTVMAILFVCTFFTASNAISAGYTTGYADELNPIAEHLGDALLESPGIPGDWYMDPYNANNATAIGLSLDRPNVLSTYKIDGLCLYNASALKKALGLDDKGELYGLRIEIRSLDGSICRAVGYPLPPDTKDVCRSVRIATIKEQDGTFRNAAVTVYLWRKYVGTA